MVLLLFIACSWSPWGSAPRAPREALAREADEEVVFAVIGDYGRDGEAEAEVAGLVASWGPDFVITLGDNNYPDGAADTIEANIGKHYGAFIKEKRFFPSLGNHDWITLGAKPYLDYFELPGNERYYDLVRGPVHLFALDSDASEIDGNTPESAQAAWLKERMSASPSAFQLVYFHHPPYSSGPHGPNVEMQWPFASWGADAVLAGHDHHYERIERDGIAYFVNGAGGAESYEFGEEAADSKMKWNQGFGAMRVSANDKRVRFDFYDIDGKRLDRHTIKK